MADPGDARQQAAARWKCENCAWTNGASARECGGCGESKATAALSRGLLLVRVQEAEAAISKSTPLREEIAADYVAQLEELDECRFAAESDAYALRLRVQEAERALRDAIELAEEGWAYAPDYFREKWRPVEEVARLRAVLGGDVQEQDRGADSSSSAPDGGKKRVRQVKSKRGFGGVKRSR